MEIEFVGAARTVTGSMHLVRANGSTILLDCGLYQGRRRESAERNRHLPLPVGEIDAVVLSHAHIDHSGALPLLPSRGFLRLGLRDQRDPRSRGGHAPRRAAIQISDARYLNKQRDRDGDDEHEPIEPLYEDEDVIAILQRFVSLPYRHKQTIARASVLTFLDAGHVLGSAITVLDVDEKGKQKRLVFTGDLGRSDRPILKTPRCPRTPTS